MVIFLYGCLFGSFLHCVAYRISRKQNFINEHSQCPHCGHRLYGKDLIPLLSWCLLKGRCRYCHQSISIRYPLAELLLGIIYYLLSVQHVSIAIYLFISTLYLASWIDYDIQEIPDTLYLPLFISWAINRPFYIPGIFQSTGVFFFLLILEKLMEKGIGKECLGMADIILFSFIALMFGITFLCRVMLFSSLAGIILILLNKQRRIPFIPFISLGVFLVLMM